MLLDLWDLFFAGGPVVPPVEIDTVTATIEPLWLIEGAAANHVAVESSIDPLWAITVSIEEE